MKLKERKKFLKSKEWLEFRNKIAGKQGGIDPITNKPLRKGFIVHHLNLDKNLYTDLSNEADFIAINSRTHKMLHFLYEIGVTYTDNEALTTTLQRMIKLNKEV